MSLFGRNDQAVTANSTTTAESTTGAPLGTYTAVKGSGNGVVPISMDANAHFGNMGSESYHSASSRRHGPKVCFVVSTVLVF